MDRPHELFVDRMGQAAESDGLSPIAGRLFAILLFSDEPRSLDELADTLGVSKASFSTAARRLLERHIAERVSRPGDRRDFYELAPDFFAQIIRARTAHWRRLQALANTVRDTAHRPSAIVRDRLASIDELHAIVIDRVDAALDEWEARARKRALKTSAPGMPRRRRTA
jgi:DNA-binding transcriptional regulator GbsR (MarR family)